MDFMLSDQDRQFRDHCRRFAQDILAPLAARYGETQDVPAELVAAMARAGLFTLLLPKELGGPGVRALPICLAREELAGVYCPADVTLAMQGLGGYPIYLAGSSAQQEKYLGPIGRGEMLASFALTEAGAGSDVNAMQSQAVERDGGFVLNGSKLFISNGYAAQFITTFVKTPQPGNPRAMSAFIVDKGTPGFKVARRLELIAPHDLTALEFKDCFLPRENLLGQVGQGFKIAMQTLEVLRMSVGAAAVGIGRAALAAALDYAQRRVQFGAPIADFQATQFKLAEMATELDAARALVYRAAIKKDGGLARAARDASMAKLYATEAAQRVVDQAVQIHGGVGLLKGSAVERLYREIRALRIYEGTSEIHKLIIARSLLAKA
ncbi:MAG: acyl-CoA dehydrogenase [Desulfarculus sp.]|nr:MAG: acyl-CoA dehydrogenase [Desulfarculus sp.]